MQHFRYENKFISFLFLADWSEWHNILRERFIFLRERESLSFFVIALYVNLHSKDKKSDYETENTGN